MRGGEQMVKKRVWLIRIIIIIVIFIIILAGRNLASEYFVKKSMKLNWGIYVPSSLRKVYRTTSSSGFHGDGVRCTIFETRKPEPSFIETFSTGRNIRSEKFIIDSLKKGNLKIPAKKKLSFENSYLWRQCSQYDTDTLVILYFPDAQRYYFIEEFF